MRPGDLYSRKCYVVTASGDRQEIIGYDQQGNPISKAPTTMPQEQHGNPASQFLTKMVMLTNHTVRQDYLLL